MLWSQKGGTTYSERGWGQRPDRVAGIGTEPKISLEKRSKGKAAFLENQTESAKEHHIVTD